MILSSAVITFMSLSALSLSQKKHCQQLMPEYKKLSPLLILGLRLIGFSGLCFAAATLVGVKGWPLGLVYWFADLTLIAFALALLLSYQSRWIFVAIVLGAFALPVSLSYAL